MMKTATGITERQQRAADALEAARSKGLTLSEYAKRHALPLRELYDGIAALRRKGVLPKPQGGRASSRFVAIRIAESTPKRASSSSSIPLCRIIQPGCVIECLQWPPPSWLAALAPGSADAAP
jgi:hypothetical protein